MALPKDPTYFQIPTRGRAWMQSVPVGWHMRPRLKGGERGARTQVLAITVEAIEGWIRAMEKVKAPKTLYPLVQATNEQFGESRISKRGGQMWSSLAFMDFDGEVSEEQFQQLRKVFDDDHLGCTFRSFTPDRAKVVFAVNGAPPVDALREFVQKMFFSTGLFEGHLPFPDTTPQALVTSFIPSVDVLRQLTQGLRALYVHDVSAFNAQHALPRPEEIQVEPENLLPEPQLPEGIPPLPRPLPPQQDADFDEVDAWLEEWSAHVPYETGENTEVIPYTHPIDVPWLEANLGAEVEQPVSRLDCIPVGGGWVRGWEDYEGPLPEWLMDRHCMGDQAINPRSVDGKLVRWLLGSAKALCETGVDIPQRDVAEYLGVTQAAISKSVKKFVERGWLSQLPHHFKIGPNTRLEALAKIDGLVWNPVAGEGGEVVGVDLHGHWSYGRSQLITAAMGFPVGPKALKYITLDLAIRFACLQILRERGRRKVLEDVEQLLGLPEDQVIEPGHWTESLWGLMRTGYFQEADIWYDYCSRIPGIHDPANTPRIRKLDLIWSWVEEHWPSVREG